MRKFQTIKMWKSTLLRLRMIYAFTGESMASILDRLIVAELERVKKDAESAQD